MLRPRGQARRPAAQAAGLAEGHPARDLRQPARDPARHHPHGTQEREDDPVRLFVAGASVRSAGAGTGRTRNCTPPLRAAIRRRSSSRSAAKMVRLNPILASAVRIQETAKTLACPELGTRYRALSAEATTAFGLSPSLIIHDELGSRSRAAVAAVRSSRNRGRGAGGPAEHRHQHPSGDRRRPAQSS